MGIIVDEVDVVYADGPSGSPTHPPKVDVRQLFRTVEQQISSTSLNMRWTLPVRVCTTTAGTLASSFENGDTVDGITLATGNRILIRNQADSTENGIYVVQASGAPTRATDADAGSEFLDLTVYVQVGTTNGGKAFTCTNTVAPTPGSTGIAFAEVYDIKVLNTSKADASQVSALDARVTAAENSIAGFAPINNPTFTGTVSGITKAMVGLGNVDNTSDATKNAAAATLTNKTLTAPVINSPTGIVKGDVGLGNVDNTSDANKPVSIATAAAISAEAAARIAADDTEAAARIAGDNTEAAARLSGDQAIEARTITASGMAQGGGNLSASREISVIEATTQQMREATSALAAASARRVKPLIGEMARPLDTGRPGEAPWRFYNGSTGSPGAATSFTDADVATTTTRGNLLRRTGAHIVAPIHGFRMLAGRKYLVKAYISRNSLTEDPAANYVQLRGRWLNGLWASLGSNTLATNTTLIPGSGNIILSAVVSTAAAVDVDMVAAAGTVYCRPYVEWFGSAGENQTEDIQWIDITDLGGYSPDLTSIDGRVTALEGIDAGDRLDLIEAQLAGPSAMTYETLADAIGADIPGAVDIVRVLRYNGSANARDTIWLRTGSAPTDGTTYFQNTDDSSYWILTAGRGIAYVLWTGQSNAQQGSSSGANESVRSPRAKIWNGSAWADIAPGVGGLNTDNKQHSLYTITRRMIEEDGYYEVRVIYEAQGGRPIADWAGNAEIPGTANMGLGAAVTHASIATTYTRFANGDTLTLHSALSGGGSSIRTLAITNATTIRDILQWIRLESRIRAGLDINGQQIILESDADYSITNNQAGGSTFATVNLDFTPADRTLNNTIRPRADSIVSKCTAAGVVRFDYVFWTQGEADSTTLPKVWPLSDPKTYPNQWLAWVQDFETRGLFTKQTKFIVNAVLDGPTSGRQSLINRALMHLPTMRENVALASSSGFIGEDEGLTDSAGVPYRVHFSAADTEEYGNRMYLAAKALLEGGQPSNHNRYPYEDSLRPDGTMGVTGHAYLLTSGTGFIATKREFRGTSIRATGTMTIHLDDRELHPTVDVDFGREIEIYSVSTGTVLTIETGVHEIFDEWGDVLNTTRYTITRQGSGVIRLRYMVSQWRVVHDTFSNDWQVGGTLQPTGSPATYTLSRDECMSFSYVANAGAYVLPAADSNMMRMKIILRTAGEITLDCASGAIYAGQGSPNFAGTVLYIPADQVIVLQALTSQRWGIIGGTWQAQKKHVVAKTSNFTLTRNESGKVFTNAGAAGSVNYSLPAAEAGLFFDFIVTVAQQLRITSSSASGDRIRDGAALSAAGGYMQSSTIGDVIRFYCADSTYWHVAFKNGAGWSAPST